MLQSEDYDQTVAANASALGQVNLLEKLIELDYETFAGAFENEHE